MNISQKYGKIKKFYAKTVFFFAKYRKKTVAVLKKAVFRDIFQHVN